MCSRTRLLPYPSDYHIPLEMSSSSSTIATAASSLTVAILPQKFIECKRKHLKLTPLLSSSLDIPLFIAECETEDHVMKIVEIMQHRRRVGSWMILENSEVTVGGDGNMAIMTEVDVMYIILDLLEKARTDVWQPLSELIGDGYFLLKKLFDEKDMNFFCEGKIVDGLNVWKVCEEKVLKWLMRRFEKVVNIDGVGRKQAAELVRRYTGTKWGNLFWEKVVGEGTKRKNPGEELAYEAMMEDLKPNMKKNEERGDKQPPAKRRKSAAQIKLDKVDKTGIRHRIQCIQSMSYQEWGGLQPARYAHLHELTSGDPIALKGSSVRVVGRVVDFSVATSKVFIEFYGARMTVLAALLGELGKFRPSSMWQFFGELDVDNQGVICLRARIARDVSGIAPDLYDRCLRIRRRYEDQVLK